MEKLRYKKIFDDWEEWYDEQGNCVHLKRDGEDVGFEYDDKGHNIHFYTTNGYEGWQ